jgi:hypothetical protein
MMLHHIYNKNINTIYQFIITFTNILNYFLQKFRNIHHSSSSFYQTTTGHNHNFTVSTHLLFYWFYNYLHVYTLFGPPPPSPFVIILSIKLVILAYCGDYLNPDLFLHFHNEIILKSTILVLTYFRYFFHHGYCRIYTVLEWYLSSECRLTFSPHCQQSSRLS